MLLKRMLKTIGLADVTKNSSASSASTVTTAKLKRQSNRRALRALARI